MGFVAVEDQVITLLRQRGRVAYHTLKRQFQRNDEAIENLTIALIDAQPLARLSHWDGPLSAGNLPDKAWWPQVCDPARWT